MRIFFTDEQKKMELNKIEVEDVLFEADWIEYIGEDYFMAEGKATIDGEVYHDFPIEFKPETKPEDMEDIAEILQLEWEFYDFLL